MYKVVNDDYFLIPFLALFPYKFHIFKKTIPVIGNVATRKYKWFPLEILYAVDRENVKKRLVIQEWKLRKSRHTWRFMLTFKVIKIIVLLHLAE